MIAVATRRKIDTLTIVAGPTSAGKSTLISKLESSPELCRSLGIPEKIDTTASYKLYHDPTTTPFGHVLFHYDILRPFGRALRTHDRDPVLSLLSSAKKVNIITIQASPERLVEQITTGEPADSSRHQKIKAHYADGEFLNRWYKDWNNYIARVPGANIITVENDGEFRLKK